MSLKRKNALMRQKDDLDRKLKDRLARLAGEGVEPARADRDTIARKLKAEAKEIGLRLKAIADSEKLTLELAKMKADRAAAALKEKEGGKPEKAVKPAKGEKPKKGGEGGEAKKPKPEKKAPPKAPEAN
ncbi:MAG: hypothetical protein FJY80_12340 [Candidatus Aminicenantes bacterium]|nr:hypothetical protein [Candidatus Aminicenantes bacterium]